MGRKKNGKMGERNKKGTREKMVAMKVPGGKSEKSHVFVI